MAQESVLRPAVESVIQADDGETRRKAFAALSEGMIEVAEVFGLARETVYVDYCPMVFGDTGAEWLSEFGEIANPYFGDAMLRCGEVRREIEPQADAARPNPQMGHKH